MFVYLCVLLSGNDNPDSRLPAQVFPPKAKHAVKMPTATRSLAQLYACGQQLLPSPNVVILLEMTQGCELPCGAP